MTHPTIGSHPNRLDSPWSEFVAMAELNSVEPVRRLNTDPERHVVQYFEADGSERFAVRETRAYGSISDVVRPDLMRVTGVGPDYSIFEVPEDTLSLRAITLGTGRGHSTDLLRGIYNRAGDAVGRLLTEVQAPLLSVADLAVVRPAATVLFIPPVHFGEGTSNPEEHINSLSASLEQYFGNVWNKSALRELSFVLATGVRDAISR